ncbi:MAG: DUF6058 family natural product biosynthesis protein [Pseudomonadota bacterium]
MLFNYLFANFYEEADFLRLAGVDAGSLQDMIDNRIMPQASYVLEGHSRVVSFVSDHNDAGTYRFHLKGHLEWLTTLRRLGLDSEALTRSYFKQAFETAAGSFFSGALGREFRRLMPDLPKAFDDALFEATWGHFLNGVYGVCTRDGQPASIFLKQAGVMFIEQVVAQGAAEDLSAGELDLLRRAVRFLDDVESDFAPHEVAQSSRQRCVIDVQKRFLG